MVEPFVITRRVQFAETDLAGVLHFSNYFRWMEEVEHAFWRSESLSVIFRRGDGHISWPRVSVTCDYFAPLHFEDEVELRFRVVKIGEKSLTFEVEFVQAGERIALGKITAVCCATTPGAFESVSIPSDIRHRLEARLRAS
jgi:YbgC/YbaW family acyl-CoA thioester hydrolase